MVTLNKENLELWQQQDLEPLRYDYDLTSDDHVMDIGSYMNEWGNEIKRLYGCKVEPFDALNNKAAWIKDGVLTFGGAYYYSSIYEPGTTTYKCVDIAPYLSTDVALVKINIEGAEYDLLDYILSKGLHKNIKYLQVQFHQVEGMDYLTRYEQIKNILQTTHKLQWRYPFVWESWELIK